MVWATEDDIIPVSSSRWGAGAWPPWLSISFSLTTSNMVMSTPAYGTMPSRHGVMPLHKQAGICEVRASLMLV